MGIRSHRGSEFVRLAIELGTSIANAFDTEVNGHTCDFDLQAEPKEIDHVCVDKLLHRKAISCHPIDSSATVSDHRCVALELEFVTTQASTLPVGRPPGKPVGWRCNSEQFSHDVKKDLSDTSNNISSFASAMASSAALHGSPKRRARNKLPDSHALVQQQRALEEQRRLEQNALLRQQLSKLICKVRRQVRRYTANLLCKQAANELELGYRPQKSKAPTKLADSAGQLLTDPDERASLLTTYYDDLFDGSTDVLPDWINDSIDCEHSELMIKSPWLCCDWLSASWQTTKPAQMRGLWQRC